MGKDFTYYTLCRVSERRESINIAIVQQDPALREIRYRRAIVVDGNNRRTATRSQVEVVLDNPTTPAQHLSPDLIYMNSRVKRKPWETLHKPNDSYMAPGRIPDLFLDVEGTYNGSFQNSTIIGASCAWYKQPGTLQLVLGCLCSLLIPAAVSVASYRL